MAISGHDQAEIQPLRSFRDSAFGVAPTTAAAAAATQCMCRPARRRRWRRSYAGSSIPKVIVTNKVVAASLVLAFHNGRGCQESIIGEAKSCTALDDVPTRRPGANQIACVAGMIAHNLGRELQMATQPRRDYNAPNRSALWCFRTLHTLTRLCIQRAGRRTTPEGRLTLHMSANARVREEFTAYMAGLQNAA
jgi:hypothetical protein